MFDHAILDMDGTIYRGDRPVDGAPEGVAALREAGVETYFFTNNASSARGKYADKLASFGIEADPGDVLSSGRITAAYLADEAPDARVLVLGERPLVEELEAHGVAVTDDPGTADTVVVSLDRDLSYGRLTRTLRAFDDGTRFLATNPDRTRPGSDGPVPSTGAMIGAVTGMTGREPDAVLGKPSPVAREFVTERLGVDPGRTLMVGDRLDTDIAFGAAAGMRTVLVLSGVTGRGDVRSAGVTPDHVIDTLGDIGTVLDG